MVQEAKSPVKNPVRQRCMEGFNSGIKGLNNSQQLLSLYGKIFLLHNIHKYCTSHNTYRNIKREFLFSNSSTKNVKEGKPHYNCPNHE
jgi:hypothetical protein